MSRLAASRTARRRSVRGLTLTELMIGLAAGLIVTLVGTSTFLLARQGFGTNVDQSTNLDAGRLGLDLLARNVRMAGAPPFDPATFTADTAFGLPSGAVALEGEEGGDAPDKVTVRYWSNLPYDAARMVGADCLGQAVGVGMVVNAFSVSKTDGLLCKGNGSGSSDEALPVAAQLSRLRQLLSMNRLPSTSTPRAGCMAWSLPAATGSFAPAGRSLPTAGLRQSSLSPGSFTRRRASLSCPRRLPKRRRLTSDSTACMIWPLPPTAEYSWPTRSII